MKPTTICRELGAIRLWKKADALFKLDGHIELRPRGILDDDDLMPEHEPIHPCIADVFSLAIVPVKVQGLVVANFSDCESLAAAATQLSLLKGRKKVWWVDPFSRFEVTSISGLQTFLRTEYDFPEACCDLEEHRQNVLSWLEGKLSVRSVLALKLPNNATQEQNMVERSSRFGLSRLDLIRIFDATFVAHNFQSAVCSASRIELSAYARTSGLGYESYTLVGQEYAEIFFLIAARAQEPGVIIAKVPKFAMFRELCDELGVFDGSRPVWWTEDDEADMLD